MTSPHVIAEISNQISSFLDFVDQVKDVETAEILCLESRKTWGMLFPDWSEFLQEQRGLFEQFAEGLERSVTVISNVESPPDESQFRDHALHSTECRLEAVRCLLDDQDEEQAMVALRRLVEA